MSHLFSPLSVRKIDFKNRIVVSPMCQYSSVDGYANNWHLVHLGSRAVGGAALVLTEAAAVSPEGRISPDDLGIWKDEHITQLQVIARFIQEQGAVAGIQLAHAGRKASTRAPWKGRGLATADEGGWDNIMAPAAIRFADNFGMPIALREEGIQQVIGDFRAAARRSREAGFRVIEIHAAHGYLLHQFLSPLSNNREDAYGGSFENRVRLLLEVVAAVREEWPAACPLFVRISATDWAPGGWDAEQSVQLARLLREKGVDLIDCSSGGLVPYQKIPVSPLYQTPFAEQLKRSAGILTGAVGLITTPEQANGIIQEQQADLVIMAREFLRDPYFPLHAGLQLKAADVKWPVQYERARPVE